MSFFSHRSIHQLLFELLYQTGDSGGGLAVVVDETWSLVGIVSVGRVKNKRTPTETCNLSDYVLYTDVAKFHSWINQVMMETDKDKSTTSRFKNFGNSSVPTLICTFRIHSEPHVTKFCEIKNADLATNKLDGEYTFEGTQVEKNEATGVYFTRCLEIYFVPKQIFKEFPSIDRLGIKHSFIPNFRKNFFTPDFVGIKFLLLPHNQINTIQSEAFCHFTKLEYIDLSFNKIEALKSNIFKRNLRLESINLNNNQIKMLNTNLFHNLEKLVNLNFERNECADKTNAYEFKYLRRELSTCYQACKLDEECKSNAAKELINQKEIRSIICNYDLINWKNKKICFATKIELRSDIIYEISNAEGKADTIRAVYFKSNPVVEIIPFGLIEVFPKLDLIAFHESNIPILRAKFFTKSFSKIKEVLLKQNGIQQIEDEALHELEDLEEIDLSFNEIKSINKKLFSHNPKLKVFKLDRNKIFMIQRDSFKQQPNIEELNLLGNQCINKKFGCNFIDCPELGKANDYLEDCFVNHFEQEKKLDECESLFNLFFFCSTT
jgi:Leucine-rich repeat (LRR) protein